MDNLVEIVRETLKKGEFPTLLPAAIDFEVVDFLSGLDETRDRLQKVDFSTRLKVYSAVSWLISENHEAVLRAKQLYARRQFSWADASRDERGLLRVDHEYLYGFDEHRCIAAMLGLKLVPLWGDNVPGSSGRTPTRHENQLSFGLS